MKARNLFLTSIFILLTCLAVNAQVEVKINPLGVIFGSPDVSVEYGVSESFGVEGTILMDFSGFKVDNVKYRNFGIGARAAAKYYFNPENGFDKWHAGIYTKYKAAKGTASDNSSSEEVKSKRFAIGVLVGHKWVTKHNLVFDLNIGFGRAFISNYEYNDGSSVSIAGIPLLNWDAIGTFAVGYRFGGEK